MMKLVVLALCFVAANCDLVFLTADQGAIVNSSWNQVKYNEVDILAAVFSAYPDIQARFPQFAGKDVASIKDTGAFATHAGRIVGFISQIIALADSESNASASKFLINGLAESHKARGVTKSQFNEFRSAFINYLQAHVSWGDNVAAAWTRALDNVDFILFAALDGNPL